MSIQGKYLWFLILAFGTLNGVSGQSADKKTGEVNEIFGNSRTISAELTYDFKTLIKEKDSDTYQPAKFGIYLADSTYIEKTVRIIPRGHFRKAHCQIIPLRIDFSESGFEIPGWRDLDKVKLVVKCKQGASYNPLVVKEWLVYKMYSLFTDKSYGTCLLNLTLKDSEGKKKPVETYAFFLEETDDLEKRFNAIEVESERVHANEFDGSLMNLVSVFEFMIGNLDWSAPRMHNVKTFRPEGEGRQWHIPVPYDFDFSGFVNAPYANPPPNMPVESVRERLFRGFCRPQEEYQKVFDMFIDKREEIYSLIDDCPYLPESRKKESRNYIRRFFDIIENQAQTQREIFDKCR